MGETRGSDDGDETSSSLRESVSPESQARRTADRAARRDALRRRGEQRANEVRLGQALVDAMRAWAPVDGEDDTAYRRRMAELGVLDDAQDGDEVVDGTVPAEESGRPPDPATRCSP